MFDWFVIYWRDCIHIEITLWSQTNIDKKSFRVFPFKSCMYSWTRIDKIVTVYIFIEVGHVQRIDTNDTQGSVTMTTLNTKPLVIGSLISILINTLRKDYFKLTQTNTYV